MSIIYISWQNNLVYKFGPWNPKSINKPQGQLNVYVEEGFFPTSGLWLC